MVLGVCGRWWAFLCCGVVCEVLTSFLSEVCCLDAFLGSSAEVQEPARKVFVVSSRVVRVCLSPTVWGGEGLADPDWSYDGALVCWIYVVRVLRWGRGDCVVSWVSRLAASP